MFSASVTLALAEARLASGAVSYVPGGNTICAFSLAATLKVTKLPYRLMCNIGSQERVALSSTTCQASVPEGTNTCSHS